jgi:hypothetical protein
MREVFYNSVFEFVINMKLVTVTKICLNETYNRVCVGKHLFVVFPTRNILEIEQVLLPLFFNFPIENSIGFSRIIRMTEIKLYTSVLVYVDDDNIYYIYIFLYIHLFTSMLHYYGVILHVL